MVYSLFNRVVTYLLIYFYFTVDSHVTEAVTEAVSLALFGRLGRAPF